MKFYFAIIILVALFSAGNLNSQESTGNPFAQGKFVPDISLILDTSYVARDLNDTLFTSLSLPGFSHAGITDRSLELDDLNIQQGFNLNYAELTLASVVDPYFDLFAVFHLSPKGFDIEEAYFTSRRLPAGLQVKGGKFLSQFGRINSQHSHYWDFASPPLVQAAFFGGEGLNELGLRLAWVAPIDVFLQLAIELLQGDNEVSFGRQGFDLDELNVSAARAPGLVVATLKGSFDLGNLTVLAGVSNATGKSHLDPGTEAQNSREVFIGNANVFGADLTLKYLFDSIRYLSLQAEVMSRSIHGDRYEIDAIDGWNRLGQRGRQAGLYVQAVSRLNKRFRLGARLDLIWKNNMTFIDVRQLFPENLARYTAMSEWNPTEFSRLRLQYTYDRSRYEGTGGQWQRRPVHELVLQMNITIGAHGAHAF